MKAKLVFKITLSLVSVRCWKQKKKKRRRHGNVSYNVTKKVVRLRELLVLGRLRFLGNDIIPVWKIQLLHSLSVSLKILSFRLGRELGKRTLWTLPSCSTDESEHCSVSKARLFTKQELLLPQNFWHSKKIPFRYSIELLLRVSTHSVRP